MSVPVLQGAIRLVREVSWTTYVHAQIPQLMDISPIAADDAGVEREKSELFDRFRQVRPEALEILRKLHASVPISRSH